MRTAFGRLRLVFLGTLRPRPSRPRRAPASRAACDGLPPASSGCPSGCMRTPERKRKCTMLNWPGTGREKMAELANLQVGAGRRAFPHPTLRRNLGAWSRNPTPLPRAIPGLPGCRAMPSRKTTSRRPSRSGSRVLAGSLPARTRARSSRTSAASFEFFTNGIKPSAGKSRPRNHATSQRDESNFRIEIHIALLTPLRQNPGVGCGGAP
jgi:hypothetical protein